MATKSSFSEYICDLLSGLGDVTCKSMFGGFGVYLDNIIFAIIVDDQLYFKVDKSNVEFFESMGSEPFSYNAKGKNIKMSYYEVMPEILDDIEELEKLAKCSVAISRLSKKGKKNEHI